MSPLAIIQLDRALVDRPRRGERLGPVLALALAVTAIGGASYGVAFGIWRGPEQAFYSAVKLPLLFVLVGASTAAISAILAALLRARLTIPQSVTIVALSFAITSLLLGALAPVSVFVALSAPPPDPAVLGLDEHDPRVAPSLRIAQALLLLHVAVIACAGTASVARLRMLLIAIGLPPAIAIRVVLAWITMQLFAGARLAWLLRPFGGRPHMAPSWTVPDVLEGSFHIELELHPDESLVRERIAIACASDEAAAELAKVIEIERGSPANGPFRAGSACLR